MSTAAIIEQLRQLPVHEQWKVVEAALEGLQRLSLSGQVKYISNEGIADSPDRGKPSQPLSKQLRGSIPKEYSPMLQGHIKSMRDEWDHTS